MGFIGPEQGRGRNEESHNSRRVEEWITLGQPELCDLIGYHQAIGDRRWESKLQPTWRRLILLLAAFKGWPCDRAALQSMQRDEWGKADVGQTCVIDLSGLPAKSSKEKMDRETGRGIRTDTIRRRVGENKPEIVVMYGVKNAEAWNEIAGCVLAREKPSTVGSTTFLWLPHPQRRGDCDSLWIGAGHGLLGDQQNRLE
jgi:hypothetical protein